MKIGRSEPDFVEIWELMNHHNTAVGIQNQTLGTRTQDSPTKLRFPKNLKKNHIT